MRAHARGDRLSAFDLWVLDIDGADAKLFVAEQPFVVMGHVVFDQIRRAINLADKVRLVAAAIEIAMTDLRIVFLADGVVALADVGRDVDIVGKIRDRHVDGVDSTLHFAVISHREQGLVDLDMLAAGGGEPGPAIDGTRYGGRHPAGR